MNRKSLPTDAEYYERFYESPATRVHSPEEIARLARGVTELIGWFGGDLRSVLDVGAGTGMWRDWFVANRPEVAYASTDASPYACDRYNHQQRDIARWRSRKRFDLVICQGVLPYLGNADADRAIQNLAAMCRGFLYLEAVTKDDLRHRCDPRFTDPGMHGRSATWYRARLVRHFTTVGCGLFYAKSGPLAFYDLERGR